MSLDHVGLWSIGSEMSCGGRDAVDGMVGDIDGCLNGGSFGGNEAS